MEEREQNLERGNARTGWKKEKGNKDLFGWNKEESTKRDGGFVEIGRGTGEIFLRKGFRNRWSREEEERKRSNNKGIGKERKTKTKGREIEGYKKAKIQ